MATFKKSAAGELVGQTKGERLAARTTGTASSSLSELKTQFQDQLKCLEQRTDVAIDIFEEASRSGEWRQRVGDRFQINEFCKRRAEIEVDYAKQVSER